MRINLDTDPRILAMAAELSIPELHVIGCCWKVWSWADAHTLDGNAIRVTDVTLDRFTSVTGFAHALRSVGWLEGESGAISFPRFAEHNGQTAKKRGETAIRVAKSRNAKRVTDVTQKVLPEKRREEKNTNTTPAYQPEDLQTAERFWGKIEAMQPGRKKPNLEAWAKTCRLMREADKRSGDDVLRLLARVQQDSFWFKQILSPDKIREKWDDLQLKLGPQRNFTALADADILKPLPEMVGIGGGK